MPLDEGEGEGMVLQMVLTGVWLELSCWWQGSGGGAGTNYAQQHKPASSPAQPSHRGYDSVPFSPHGNSVRWDDVST